MINTMLKVRRVKAESWDKVVDKLDGELWVHLDREITSSVFSVLDPVNFSVYSSFSLVYNIPFLGEYSGIFIRGIT